LGERFDDRSGGGGVMCVNAVPIWGVEMAASDADRSLICIVDDDVSFREAMEGWLTAFGFPARSFGSPDELLTTGLPDPILCMILDVQMVGMSGLDLQLRLAAMGQNIPIIFISSFDDPRTRAKALAAGAIAFLGKPFDRDALMAIIEGLPDIPPHTNV